MIPHQAFKIEYDRIARELRTGVYVSVEKFTPAIKPNMIQCSAIWDTGATSTVISPAMVGRLGLHGQEIDQVTVRGVNSSSKHYAYLLRSLLLPNNVVIQNINVIESEVHNADMLIGMDLITNGDFTISHHGKKTTFCFSMPPHENIIDLVERSNRVNQRFEKKRRKQIL